MKSFEKSICEQSLGFLLLLFHAIILFCLKLQHSKFRAHFAITIFYEKHFHFHP